MVAKAWNNISKRVGNDFTVIWNQLQWQSDNQRNIEIYSKGCKCLKLSLKMTMERTSQAKEPCYNAQHPAKHINHLDDYPSLMLQGTVKSYTLFITITLHYITMNEKIFQKSIASCPIIHFTPKWFQGCINTKSYIFSLQNNLTKNV